LSDLAFVRMQAVRWVSDDFPGWVEVELIDRNGKRWTFIDKASIFDQHNVLSSSTAYPMDLRVACRVQQVVKDSADTMYVISTGEPWGVETVDGVNGFEVWSDQMAAEDH